MDALGTKTSVKVVGSNGQISLGKEFAGRQVVVEQREPGVWLVRTASVVPDNERWLHQAGALRELQQAIDWANVHQPQPSDPDAVFTRLEHVDRRKRKQKQQKSSVGPKQRDLS